MIKSISGNQIKEEDISANCVLTFSYPKGGGHNFHYVNFDEATDMEKVRVQLAASKAARKAVHDLFKEKG